MGVAEGMSQEAPTVSSRRLARGSTSAGSLDPIVLSNPEVAEAHLVEPLSVILLRTVAETPAAGPDL